VLPLQRKAMRGILTGAGVRVVANKKKYVIEAKVVDAAELDMSDVPAAAREEYYELEVSGSLVFIRTATQMGALWGMQGVAAIYQALARGVAIPNLLIRDWPLLPNRGIFVENKWGPDRMTLTDWCLVIDRLARMKMNRLGIGLYGCWGSCRFEDRPTEFLLASVPEHEELVNEHRLRWYSPDAGKWQDETYLPRLVEDDCLGAVVEYGREKGVTVIPFVNSLGHNTLIPRTIPEISAKDADGNPVGMGYCLSNPKTREFIKGFYESIIDRYFPEGIDYFHIQMDEVYADYPDPEDPHKVGSPWCQCEQCRKTTQEELLRDYIFWLLKMLTAKGVGRVVMWNDQLTRHMTVLDADFVAALDKEGLKERLILHWWWYSNDALNDQTRVKIGRDLGLEGWVAPMTCYYNWSRYDYRFPNIEMMLRMGADEGATGALSYAVHDPGHADHEALLAAYAWAGPEIGSGAEVRKKWAAAFGDHSEAVCKGIDEIVAAVTGSGVLGVCHHYTYTYCRGELPWPRPYPGEALEKLEAVEGEDVPARLDEIVAAAIRAAEQFAPVVAEETLHNAETACVKGLLAEAARIEAEARVFAFLLRTRQAVAAGTAGAEDAKACTEIRGKLKANMAVFEKNMVDWVVPASLQSLSVLYEFLGKLAKDLKAGNAVRWTL
jgi:hypothetical protein